LSIVFDIRPASMVES